MAGRSDHRGVKRTRFLAKNDFWMDPEGMKDFQDNPEGTNDFP